MIQDLSLHIKVELFKILRSRLGRIALITTFAGMAVPTILIAALGDQRVSTFPTVVVQLLLPSLSILLGIISVIMALSSWGDEFEHGTIRTVLSRCPARWQFVLGKTVALAITLLAIIALAIAVEVLVATSSHFLQLGSMGLADNLNRLFRVIAPLAAVWWLGGMVYCGVVSLVTVGGQNSALSMIMGLGLFLADLLLGGFGLTGAGSQYRPYSIIHNSLGVMYPLLDHHFNPSSGVLFSEMTSMSLPEPGQALFRLLLYAAGTSLLTLLIFNHRDIDVQVTA